MGHPDCTDAECSDNEYLDLLMEHMSSQGDCELPKEVYSGSHTVMEAATTHTVAPGLNEVLY
jgi:hypothetical protein